MLIEEAIANIQDSPGYESSADIDWLDLTWLECRQRANKKRTRAGHDLSILLRLNKSLGHGDVLYQPTTGSCIVVNLLPTEVIAVLPQNPAEWATAAYELGNLHVPIELGPNELITPHDTAIEALLQRLNLPLKVHTRRFQPTLWPEFVSLSKDFRVKII